MKHVIDNGDGTKTTVYLLWKPWPESTPPTKPTGYDVDYSENPEDAWSKHPVLARGGYAFISVKVNDGAFSTPLVSDVSFDP